MALAKPVQIGIKILKLRNGALCVSIAQCRGALAWRAFGAISHLG